MAPRNVHIETDCVTGVEFPSARLVFTLLAFFGFLNIYCLRVNLSVALVAMVNHTEHKNVTDTECVELIEEKDHNATEVCVPPSQSCTCSIVPLSTY